MLIKEKIGQLKDFDASVHSIDWLLIEWYETSKRILHKKTSGGREVHLKFLKENPNLQKDDVLFKENDVLIVVDIIPTEVIVLKPSSMHDMAILCYEIGNKHLPLYYEDDMLLMPFEEPLFRWLMASGFKPEKHFMKLHNPLRTSVAAHGHSESLFSKILKLTSSSNA